MCVYVSRTIKSAKMKHSRINHLFGAIIVLLALAILGAVIVMALWNSTLPAITGFSAIDFWQAFGLLALGLTLSGSLLIPLMAIAHLFHPEHKQWNKNLRAKWHSMSEEERKEFFASRGFKITQD